MADFTRKKLQIFVSSTFSDLRSERQAAVEAILTAGHIPAGMELFTAGDESQMEVIKQWIDESDVYVLILGGRYGSVEPTTGKSYTELEYGYALSKGKPLFACVIKDETIEAKVKAEGRSVIEQENPQKLKEFRVVVLTKMSKFWEDTKDIKIVITETLSHLARREDLIGWVRADSQSDLPALADEIARLSKENAQLRTQLGEAVREERISGLSFAELKALVDSTGATAELVHIRDMMTEGNTVWVYDIQHSAGRDLLMRGLIKPVEKHVELTEAGRMFLNKYDACQLAENAQSVSKTTNDDKK